MHALAYGDRPVPKATDAVLIRRRRKDGRDGEADPYLNPILTIAASLYEDISGRSAEPNEDRGPCRVVGEAVLGRGSSGVISPRRDRKEVWACEPRRAWEICRFDQFRHKHLAGGRFAHDERKTWKCVVSARCCVTDLGE